MATNGEVRPNPVSASQSSSPVTVTMRLGAIFGMLEAASGPW